MDFVSLETKFGVGIGIVAVVGYFLIKLIKLNYESDNENNENRDDSEYEDEDQEVSDSKRYKLVLLIRNDLKMSKGKVAAQCAHAAVAAYKSALKHKKLLKLWEQNGQPKITLKVESEEELLTLKKEAKYAGLLTNVICDAGRTQIDPGTKTVCAIGPGPDPLIDTIAGHLKLY